MQTSCTELQTDNHTNTPSLNFYRPDALVDAQPTMSKHTHPFNGPLSGTTRVSQYQKGKTNLDFTVARDSVAVASAGAYASLHLVPDR